MTVGISTVAVADRMLDWLRGTAPATIAGLYLKLHTGDPGAAGTANASAVTTRPQITMAAASGGAMSLSSASGSYTMTATETITHVSVWDASTAGTFLMSMALTTSRSVVNGDVLTINSVTISHTPLAA